MMVLTGANHTFPYEHEWDWGKTPPRQPATPVSQATTALGGAMTTILIYKLLGFVLGMRDNYKKKIYMWHFICNQKDIDDLMTVFNYFHDSCIKELNYISGAYVDGNLAMNPMNTKRCLKVIVNRQEENPIAIEMEFSNLIKLNLEPSNELYTCEIGQVDLYIENGKIYWIADFDAQDLTHFKGTWICAEKLRWRFAEKYIGESAVYGTAAVDV